MGWTLQLINDISKDIKKLLTFFSRTDIFTPLNTPLSAAVSGLKKLDPYLKDDESSVVTLAGFPLFRFCLSLLNYHRLSEMSEQLSLYSVKLYICIIISRLSALSTCSSFMWLMHFENGAQFLNATLVLASPSIAVMSPVTRICATE